MSETVKINDKEVNVEQVRNDWALALMSKGLIVRLTIGRWGGKTRLNYEDLGLKFSDTEAVNFAHEYINLGSLKLFPPEISTELLRIERAARENLFRYSYDTLWGRFIPVTAFDAWKEQDDIFRNDYMMAAQAIGVRHDEIVAAVKSEYRKMAKDVWARLYPEDKAGAPQSFIENFVGNVVAKIPSREDIAASFKYDLMYLVIPMPSLIEENLARAQDIKRESEEKNFNSILEQQTRTILSQEYIRRKKELIDGFLEKTVVSMRHHIAELCTNILTSINRKSRVEKVTVKEINKLRTMISDIGLLNFHNDAEVNKLLKELNEEVEKFKGERNDDIVVTKLQEIVDVSSREFVLDNFNPMIDYLEI